MKDPLKDTREFGNSTEMATLNMEVLLEEPMYQAILHDLPRSEQIEWLFKQCVITNIGIAKILERSNTK